MANIPNSRNYQTTGSNSARRGSSPHSSSQTQHQSTGKSSYSPHQNTQDYNSLHNNKEGGSIWPWIIGAAVVIKFPILSLAAISLGLWAKK